MHAIKDYGAFVAAFIVFLAIPGPGNLVLIMATGKGRVAGGLAAMLGIIGGDQVLLWLAMGGMAALVTTNPAVFGMVQYAGAVYLAYLGIRMWLSKPGDAPVIRIEPRRYFQQALTITLMNPKAIVFYMAFLPMFIEAQRGPTLETFATLAATAAGITVAYCAVAIAITHMAAERVRSSPRAVGWLNKLAGSMLVGFGAKLALSK